MFVFCILGFAMLDCGIWIFSVCVCVCVFLFMVLMLQLWFVCCFLHFVIWVFGSGFRHFDFWNLYVGILIFWVLDFVVCILDLFVYCIFSFFGFSDYWCCMSDFGIVAFGCVFFIMFLLCVVYFSLYFAVCIFWFWISYFGFRSYEFMLNFWILGVCIMDYVFLIFWFLILELWSLKFGFLDFWSFIFWFVEYGCCVLDFRLFQLCSCFLCWSLHFF